MTFLGSQDGYSELLFLLLVQIYGLSGALFTVFIFMLQKSDSTFVHILAWHILFWYLVKEITSILGI